MNKENLVDLCKTRVLCEEMLNVGINFVPMPILDHGDDLKGLIDKMNERLDKLMLVKGGDDE